MIYLHSLYSLKRDNKKLCQFLDTMFDSSIIVDEGCNIINYGKGYLQLYADVLEQYLDKNIQTIDAQTPFHRAIHLKMDITNQLTSINGKKVLQNIYPILYKDKVIGALAVSNYVNLDFLKEQLLQTNNLDSLAMLEKTQRRQMNQNPLQLTKDALAKPDPILDPFIDAVFDAAIIVDHNHQIVRCNMGRLELTQEQVEEMSGKNISLFDQDFPFTHVFQTKKAVIDYMCFVFGRMCLNCLYPIFDSSSQKVIGVLGTIQYSTITHLKKLFQTSENEPAAVTNITARLENTYIFDDFVGNSRQATALIHMCKKIAPAPYPVLITGESGTGKEILAGAIHSATLEQEFKPYVKINCSAIPHELLESELFGHKKGAFTGAQKDRTGYFEAAAGGTLLLDEIGDMDFQLQSKLLRVLESKIFSRVGDTKEIKLTARIIASTNKNLYERSMEGSFRLDLYYRLNTLEIYIPPLRERKDDIPYLISHFLLQSGANVGIRPDAMELLCGYDWPGNVRELRNLIQRIGILHSGQSVSADHIRSYLHMSHTSDQKKGRESSEIPVVAAVCSLKEGEIKLIEAALAQERYNISNAAQLLGITRATLYNKIKKYQISTTPHTFRIS